MMDEQHEHNEKNEQGLRKLLKSLPNVKASPDFEQRLRERMRAKSQGRGWPEILLVPQRHPVFAYSLASLVVVGFFSYYLFFRIGFVPAPGETTGPTIQENSASPPGHIDMPIDRNKLKENIRENGVREQPVSQRKLDAPISGQAQSTGERGIMDQRSAKLEKDQPMPQPQVQVDEFQLRRDADKTAPGELKKTLPMLSLPSKSQNVDASQAPQMFQMSSAPVAAVGRDSLSLTDSLRADSIQNAQKPARTPLPPIKAKKRDE